MSLPEDEPATLPRRAAWFSYRSVACHGALSLLLPAFFVATWWQVERAASGNPLSYLYAVEWPAFAIVAVWAWWQIIHLPPPGDDAWKKPLPSPIWLSWDRKLETAELRSYNSYLVQLHVSGRYQRWRAPRLDKGDTPLEINGTGGAEAP